ncbi:MAG: DUF2313 domain-containing protein [Oscillospiraceae bacterium]|nr:DUF2313 domain-containing protein [Oscillospiraceae bacterium]
MNLSSYERILRFVPVFFRDIFEMDSIYRVDGEMVDELILKINIVKANRYILSADEETISELEAFLGLESDSDSTLDDRRNLLVSYFTGFGKLSATTIKSIIKSLSDADSEVTFLPADNAGNNCLNINIFNPSFSYRLDNIVKVLSKRIPGHIWYKIRIQHEKKATSYIGFALQGGSTVRMTVAGIDPNDYNWLIDEIGNLLLDENGLILLD